MNKRRTKWLKTQYYKVKDKAGVVGWRGFKRIFNDIPGKRRIPTNQ